MQPGLCTFEGEISQDICRRLTVTGRCQYVPRAFQLDLNLRALKLDLAAPIDRFLPDTAAQELHKLKLRGRADLYADLRYDEERGLIPVRVSGSLTRAYLNPPMSSFPLKGVSGDFNYQEDVLQLSQFEAELAGSRLTGAARLEFEPDSYLWLISQISFIAW